jgi:hypothetical protein
VMRTRHVESPGPGAVGRSVPRPPHELRKGDPARPTRPSSRPRARAGTLPARRVPAMTGAIDGTRRGRHDQQSPARVGSQGPVVHQQVAARAARGIASRGERERAAGISPRAICSATRPVARPRPRNARSVGARRKRTASGSARERDRRHARVGGKRRIPSTSPSGPAAKHATDILAPGRWHAPARSRTSTIVRIPAP